MVRNTILAAASALALAACGQSTKTAEAPMPEAPAAAPAQATMTDADFVQLVSNSDAFEIQASQLASERAARQEVKDFAAMMVRDHTATSQELSALAPSLGVNVTAAIDAEHQLALDTLRGANGAAFDDAYLDRQVEAHQSAIAAFQNYIQTSGSGPLYDWAQTTLPKLQAHLSAVQSLENAT